MRTRGYRTTFRWLAITSLVCGLLAMPSQVLAQAEVSGVIGGMLGGDLNNVLAGTSSLKSTFDNGALYGVRAGWMSGFLGVEGSFVLSPTGLSISSSNSLAGVDAKVYYGEANALFFLLPGPVKPFLSAGGGWHSYTFDVNAAGLSSSDKKVDKGGWNFGGGLKINISGLTLRGDVRDHLTKIGPNDFALPEVAQAVGITNEQTLHNVEISGSIGVRF